MDLGCYCVSCIRYLVGAEPLSVSVAGTLATGHRPGRPSSAAAFR